jgi:predicted GH43/DUF377 family glycosyl hydrolase
MIQVKKEGVILEATENEFENHAVLNPTCVQDGNNVHMFYRAVKEGNYSSIGYCRLDGPLTVVERSNKPVLFPEQDYEKQGIEDPRIVFFEGTYYMFYTVFDGKNATGAYATSTDLKKWIKKGIITPIIAYSEAKKIFSEGKSKLKERYYFFESYIKDMVADDILLWEKDVFMFPKKFNNKFVLIHRVLPDIQIAYFNDFSELNINYWKEYLKRMGDRILLEPEFGYESRNIGAGAPMIETEKGWLMIYHAVEDSNKGKVYHASAALLDKNDPQKVIGRLSRPLFSPELDYETHGDVNNVVFPSGTAIFGDRLYIYYGAADKRIAAASVNLKELLNELLRPNDALSEIGLVAGQIYSNCLKNECKIEDLKKIISKDEKVIMMAIGWLAREEKIESRYDNGELTIKVKK